MASLRPDWPDALDPVFRKIYGEELNDVTTKYQDIFNMESSDRQNEKTSSASGLSKLVQTSENASISYEDELQGYDQTYTHKKWALGTSVSEEMWSDDQHAVMRRKPRNLAKAKKRTLDQSGADIFNYGFTAGGGGQSTFTAGDALALFTASHTRTDGGASQSNYTTSDLAEDALETGIVTLANTLDNKGQLIGFEPNTLLIPRALEKEARILLQSQGRVGTANNDINPYQGRLNIVVWDRLGSTGSSGSDTAWFLLDSSGHYLTWYNREDKGLVGPEYDFDNGRAKWKVVTRYSLGFDDWRGTYGSKGDNS